MLSLCKRNSADFKPFSRCEIYAVLGNFCAVFFFIYTSYCGLESLQSTMNIQSGLGTTSIGLVAGCSILSSLFVGPVIVGRFSPKRTLFLAWFAQTLFAAANFYPTWATLIPASAVVGMFGSVVAIVYGIYIASLAQKRTDLLQFTDKFQYERSRQNLVVRYNAVLSSAVAVGAIAGSLIGSLIIGNDSKLDRNLDNNVTGSNPENSFTTRDRFKRSNWNLSDVTFASSLVTSKEENSSESVCGADHCPFLEEHQQSFAAPDQKLVFIMIGVFLACNITGIILTVVLRPLDNEHHLPVKNVDTVNSYSARSKMMGTFRLMTDSRLLLLIPTMMLMGALFSFALGAFNQSFVGCALGIGMIGYGMISFRIAYIVLSLLAGKLVDYIHRRWLVLGAMVADLVMIVTWFMWRRSESDLVFILLWCVAIGGLHGLARASVYGIFPTLFSDKLEYALAHLNLWENLGASLMFFINDHLCFRIKAYIIFAATLVALATYSVLEFRIRDRKSSKQDQHQLEICIEVKSSTQPILINSKGDTELLTKDFLKDIDYEKEFFSSSQRNDLAKFA